MHDRNPEYRRHLDNARIAVATAIFVAAVFLIVAFTWWTGS